MMSASLTQTQFDVLRALMNADAPLTQRELKDITGSSLGRVSTAVREREALGYIAGRTITQAGLGALASYKVDNAVILAADMSSRFALISYERPRGTLRIHGEILIERQIRQLQKVSITDITVAVGYKKEYFFNLAEKFDVTIVVNPEYTTRNNNGSLWLVLDRLVNTYIYSSDDYFTTNPFESHVYRAYYPAEYVEGPTNEWCITTGGGRRITGAKVGGTGAWTMLGHVYFDRTFSSRFREILRAVYQLPETSGKLWESIHLDHVKELDMVIRKYPAGVIYEFDSIDKLRFFDPKFMENVDPEISDTISKTLNCPEDDITDFYPLEQGITNLLCHFRVGGEEYVYHHPGVSTSKIVDRLVETEAPELVCEIGVDRTFLASDPEEGWKISRFIPQCRNLDVTKDEELETAIRMNRKLHELGRVLARNFDFIEEGLHYESLLREFGPIEVPGYEELRNKVLRLKTFAGADGFELGPSHNDFFPLNFLVSAEGRIDLIGWGYAGMLNIAADFEAMVACIGEMDEERADTALKFYSGRTPTELEKCHFRSYVVFAGWCWYVWVLLEEAEGDNIGEVLYVYYRHAADYVSNLLVQYEGAAKKEGVNV